MIKSIFLKISIFLVAFLMLCTSLVALAVDDTDEYLGEWLLNDGRVPCYNSSFYMRGEFEFPEVQTYLEDNGFSNIDIIGVSLDDEGPIDDYTEYVSGFFWVSNSEIYAEGGYLELCYFTVYYNPYVDPDPPFSTSVIHDFSWTFAPITYFNILSLDPVDDWNMHEFSDFIEYNFHRYEAPPPPIEPTNIYQSCYDLLNTWIFGGTVVQGSFHDLVLILISTICVLLLVALPILIVWRIIRIWF